MSHVLLEKPVSISPTTGYNESRTESINEVHTMENKLLDWSAHENCKHIPNAETIAAIEETEEIIRNMRAGTDTSPTYSCFAEILAEIDAELEAEGYVIQN